MVEASWISCEVKSGWESLESERKIRDQRVGSETPYWAFERKTWIVGQRIALETFEVKVQKEEGESRWFHGNSRWNTLEDIEEEKGERCWEKSLSGLSSSCYS